jgi:Raf kinase inhibitor-like YbhB/YbcL family protein
MELSSPASRDGDPIPGEYGHTESNANPPLETDGVPDGAESLALVVDDPDAVAPAGKVWDHWVVWNVDPDVDRIPEDWETDAAVEGRNDFGETGYGGPDPPDRRHTYHFSLSALDTTLGLAAGATKGDLENAMDGHLLAEAELRGTYVPRRTEASLATSRPRAASRPRGDTAPSRVRPAEGPPLDVDLLADQFEHAAHRVDARPRIMYLRARPP